MLTESQKKTYQELILSHSRRPKHFCRAVSFDQHGVGRNRLCGDVVEIFLKWSHDRETLEEVSFAGESCSVCKASASMLTDMLTARSGEAVQQTVDKVLDFARDFHPAEELGDLQAFVVLRDFPTRTKCMTLPWQTLADLLSGGGYEESSTEPKERVSPWKSK